MQLLNLQEIIFLKLHKIFVYIDNIIIIVRPVLYRRYKETHI